MTARRWILVIGLLALAGLGWRLWTSDARIVERRLDRLVDLASKSPLETRLRAATTARAIVELFAAEFELAAEPEGYATRDRADLTRAIIAYRARSESLAVRIVGRELFFESGGGGATHFAYARFVNDLGDLAGTATYPVRVGWVKEDGEWRIARLEILPPESGLN